MTIQIHRIVQDAHNFNSPYVITAIQHEVAATPALSRHVQATQTSVDLVPRRTVWSVRAIVKRCECGNQRASVNQGLPSPKVFRGPLDNSDEVALRRFGESNAPSPRSQTLMLAGSTAELLVSDPVQVRLEGSRRGEFLEGPAVEGSDACMRSIPQCQESGRILDFAALDQPQTIADDFARILIPARSDQRLNQVRLLVGQDHIARGHDRDSTTHGRLCQSSPRIRFGAGWLAEYGPKGCLG